ncbi:MAG TPA: glycosyltransferase family 9 protein, partial [Burkholderiaceae bacterium]|nr:glycosyltransferase family 9 protein [Burkholderiaceae bacterium]
RPTSAQSHLFPRKFRRPLWLRKERLDGDTILLHGEQGYGDMIQFCRYVPLVAELGAKVLLEVPRPLARLMENLEGVDEVIVRGDQLPDFDYHCPLMSLPLAFDTRLETIPAKIPYLAANSGGRSVWQERLGDKSGPRIGIAWSGNPVHDNDRNRSIALDDFIEIVSESAQFVCLQKEVRPADHALLQQRSEILTFNEGVSDFQDTAELIANMDLVISVDTSVAHLAGAMGKPVWILLPFNVEWRWFLDRSDSPWYPTARLFRQQTPGNWKPVLAAIARELSLL